jgi:hypothetical protein
LVVSLVQQLEAKALAETVDFGLKAKLEQIIDNFRVGILRFNGMFELPMPRIDINYVPTQEKM